MQSRHLATIAAISVLVIGAVFYFLWPADSIDFARLRGNRPFNVVVITLDTTRADRLGAYGFEGVQTPAIDSLAREGILFRSAHAVTPLTLPSHTSLFSGTYPPHHGVRDNGGFMRRPCCCAWQVGRTMWRVASRSPFRRVTCVAGFRPPRSRSNSFQGKSQTPT